MENTVTANTEWSATNSIVTTSLCDPCDTHPLWLASVAA